MSDDEQAPMPGPADPMGPLATNASTLHEVFQTYVAVGFTVEQATYLVGVILATTMRQTPGGA